MNVKKNKNRLKFLFFRKMTRKFTIDYFPPIQWPDPFYSLIVNVLKYYFIGTFHRTRVFILFNFSPRISANFRILRILTHSYNIARIISFGNDFIRLMLGYYKPLRKE